MTSRKRRAEDARDALVTAIARMGDSDLQHVHSALYTRAVTLEPHARNSLLRLRDRINDLADLLKEPL